MPYTSYDFYLKDCFGDKIPEQSFSKYEYKARIELDRFTFGRLKGLPDIPQEVQQCICEMAEYLYDDEQKKTQNNGISSESTDGYSVTYQKEKSRTAVEKELYQIVVKHLGRSELLYRGVY